MYKLSMLVVGTMLCAGCATTTSTSTALDAQAVSIQNQVQSPVRFHNVRVETDAQGNSIIRGALKRVGHNPVRFGHIDYQVTDTQGVQRESGTVAYTGAIKRRLPRTASRFEIPLQQPWQEGRFKLSLQWDDRQHPAK